MGNTSRALGNWLEVMGNPSPLTYNHLPAPEVHPLPGEAIHDLRFTFYDLRFTVLLSPVIGENLIQNCQLNQSVVRSAPAFALYL
jgi:hypothetical protein